MIDTTNTIQDSINEAILMIKCKIIKGVHFVGVREYENKFGEVSNQTFNMGVSLQNVLKADLKTLKAFDINTIIEKYQDRKLIEKIVSENEIIKNVPSEEKVLEEIEKGYGALISSLIKRTASELEKAILRESGDSTIKRSDAQINAFDHIAKGLKSKDENLYIYGYMVRKTTLVKGVYPKGNSRLLTIIKNDITNQANLKAKFYKSFKLGGLETVKIQGVEL